VFSIPPAFSFLVQGIFNTQESACLYASEEKHRPLPEIGQSWKPPLPGRRGCDERRGIRTELGLS